MDSKMSTQRYVRFLASALVALALTTPAAAQTPITPDRNKYSPADDVKLGRQAADQVRKELPMLNDDRVDNYVEDVGRRLADAIPANLRHPEFRYTFDVVNQKEINAFALPGGPMFLNRGMIESAQNEAQMAGVMAHELSHVALRHGTAQATKGEKFQIGAVAGQILGAIVGGTAGSVISQGSQFGLGAYFLKYSREYERQADLLGAQIMARAGYDPREMANMFKIIERQGGRGGPEWLSDHPNPGNRYEAINHEASMLRVDNPIRNTDEFISVQSRLRGKPAAYTAEQIARGQARNGSVGTSGRIVQVAAPSNQYRTYNAGNLLRVSVPVNWRPASGNNTVMYAPDGAIFQDNGQVTYTHGVEVGVAPGSGNLQRDTEGLVQAFARSNPQLRRQGGYRRDNVGGRNGLTASLSNVSDVTGRPEYVSVSTAQLRDGSMLYVIGVAPEDEARTYDAAFRRVRQDVEIDD
jgi:Zn-dependent protease with chaperone function